MLPKSLAQIAASTKIVETPVLGKVQFDSNVQEVEYTPENSEIIKGSDELEMNELSGRDADSDFTSSWTKWISIVKSHPGFVTLKNNHTEKVKMQNDLRLRKSWKIYEKK